MGKIAFEKKVRKARLLTPLLGFKEAVHPIEFRKDPLTDRWCRINVERAKRVKQAKIKKGADLMGVIEKSKKNCFFCPENLEKMTPMFPNDFPSGRMRVGSACLFPNLFPFGEFHAIGVFSGDHYLGLDQFSPKLLRDCFRVCLDYFRFVYSKHPDARYCTINWNYLPPAAASIIHPHVQILADYKPTLQVNELIERSRAYYEGVGGNYWSDLVMAERENGKRWIGETGSIAWLASFAPQGNREVLAVSSHRISTVIKMDESDLNDFCDGLSKILSGYHEIGVGSFNMTIFSGPNDQDLSEYYLLNAKLISRPNFEPLYTGDDGFMEKFHYEPIIETMPEDLAEKLREHF